MFSGDGTNPLHAGRVYLKAEVTHNVPVFQFSVRTSATQDAIRNAAMPPDENAGER